LRKSDLLNGACRSFFEDLKNYLKKENQTLFTNAEIRKALRIHPSNQKRYMLQLKLADLISKTKGDKKKGYLFKVNDYNDYTTTNKAIKDLLETAIQQISSSSGSQ
jgi:transcription initiation factor IIE alpha subunit